MTNLADDPQYADIVAELSQQLHGAVQASYPPSGKRPPLQDSLWAPDLTNP